MPAGVVSAGCRKSGAKSPIAVEAPNRAPQRAIVVRFYQKPGLVRSKCLRNSAHSGTDDRKPARLSLGDHTAEGFGRDAGRDQQVHRGIEIADARGPTDEVASRAEPGFRGSLLPTADLRAVSDAKHAHRGGFGHQRRDGVPEDAYAFVELDASRESDHEVVRPYAQPLPNVDAVRRRADQPVGVDRVE